jgi:hypothetical protein
MEQLTKHTAKTLLIREMVYFIKHLQSRKARIEVEDLFLQLIDLLDTFED